MFKFRLNLAQRNTFVKFIRLKLKEKRVRPLTYVKKHTTNIIMLNVSIELHLSY